MQSKSKKLSVAIVSASLAVWANRSVQASGFASPNDLVLVEINGDGGNYANSVSVVELNVSTSTNGTGQTVFSLTPNATFNLPTNTLSYNGSSNLGLVLGSSTNGNADHPGELARSLDGHSLTFATYLAGVGPVQYFGSGYAPQQVPASTVPRTLDAMNAAGQVTVAATLTGSNDYNSVDIRQVTSLNGQQFWISGNGDKPYNGTHGDGSPVTDIGGLRYATAGASTTTSLNIGTGIDERTTTIFQGQLYTAGGSNNSPPGEHTCSLLGFGSSSAETGTGLPDPVTGAPNWFPLPTPTGSGYPNHTILGNQTPNFISLSNGATALYESDSTNGTIDKWVQINGLWQFEGEIYIAGKDTIEDITARLAGDGSVQIFGDNELGNSAAGQLFAFSDVGGAGPVHLNGYTSTTINGEPKYSAGAPVMTGTVASGSLDSQTYYGLAFAPSTSKAVEEHIWGNLDGVTGAAGGSWNSAGNWADGVIPSGSGSTATFGPGLTSNGSGGIITLDGVQTVGHVVFNDWNVNYTVTAGSGGSLKIDNTDPNASGVPSIFNSAGFHTITAPIILANGVAIASHYQAGLTISGAITGSGQVDTYGPGSLILAGASNYSGATIVHSGPVTVTSTGSLPITTNLTVGDPADVAAIGLSANVVFNASTGSGIRPITLASLTLASNGSVSIAKPASIASRSVLVVGGLGFAGTTGAWAGLLDLNSNDLIVHNASLTSIRSQLAQGYTTGSGAWQGSGGIISSVAAGDTTRLTTLGVIQNSVNQLPGGAAFFSSFDGQSVSASDVLVKYTYYGDANLDGQVNSSDYTLTDNGFNQHLTGWINGDFNYDGVVNGSDYTLIDNAFLQQGAQLTSQVAIPTASISSQTSSATSVPEPGGLTLLGIASLGLLKRRKSHRPAV
jgi:autotransporter-associated beta strand protein